MRKILKIFMLTLQFINLTKCDLYASLSDLEELVKTEGVFIKDLNDFLEYQEDVLEFLKKKLTNLKDEHAILVNDTDTYLSNPLNAFLMIKRLTADVDKILELSSASVLERKIDDYSSTLSIAAESDLIGSVMGLLRLQKMYGLSTLDLANGIIDGVKLREEFSAEDCFEIGKWLVDSGQEYEIAILWLDQAFERYDGKFSNFETNRIDILEYLSTAFNLSGNYENAHSAAKDLIKLDPRNSIAHAIVQTYEAHKSQLKKAKDEHLYDEACRGNLQRSAEVLSKLKCYYESSNSHFIKIAPIKVEEVNKDPMVLLFHDIATDKEIKVLKNFTRPITERSSVLSSNGSVVSEVRVSKIAWLNDDLDKNIENLSRRVGDMTGLSMESAEPFQTQTYGIGGHYQYHTDYFGSTKLDSFRGDRIGTVLMYLSDVEKGGATVFPYLKIAVKPVKGTAVFWYNLLHSGYGDIRTLHGACPVLIGSKWAANKWIHERSQIFRRPCGLSEPSNKVDYSEYYK